MGCEVTHACDGYNHSIMTGTDLMTEALLHRVREAPIGRRFKIPDTQVCVSTLLLQYPLIQLMCSQASMHCPVSGLSVSASVLDDASKPDTH